jgi:hypothetical protein
MARHPVETFVGVGALRGGDVLLREVPYRLTRWVEDDPLTVASSPRSDVEGTIDITGIAEATVLAGVDDLTLWLEDGRGLAITLTSSTGHVVARGLPGV